MTRRTFNNRILKRVLIIHTDGNTFNNPSLKCIIDLLLDKGCEIDLRYPETMAPMPPHEGIRLMPFGTRLRQWKRRMFDQYCFWPLMYLFVLVEKIHLYRKCDLILAVDRQGLVEAYILNQLTRTPYVYISFEISFADETSHKYKQIEIDASQNIAAWIVQDEVRAELLQRENHLDPRKKILLPLASAGIGVEKKEWLRNQLGIPNDKKVAIIIGAISKWTMTSQILKCVADWPEEWVLIVHDRYGQTRKLLGSELASLVGMLDRKIFVSDAAPEMVDDLGGVLAGVSAGIAFYKPEYEGGIFYGKNLEYLGLASGKISTYLRYGVPIIINEIGLYAEEARKFKFGCVADAPSELIECLNIINQESYGENAINYFSTKLDFNIYRENLWRSICSFVDH